MADLFQSFRDELLAIDPVTFAEKYLTLDGKPFKLNNNGYKPFVDIYRYIGIKSLEKNSKPVILVKGRQVGATTMASVLEAYFMSCGLFGTKGRPPIRVMHCFPTLELAYKYSKTKLNAMISGAVEVTDKKKGGKKKSYVESKLDPNTSSGESLQFKQFLGNNYLFVESTGLTGDRLRSLTVDCMLFDECQDMRPAALSNSVQILSKAQYGRVSDGVQVYFGTPKQKGTAYWRMWNESTQQYFHLGCEKCGKDFPLYTPGGDVWEKIWINDSLPESHPNHGFIVRCVHCDHEQDKRVAVERGKWVAYGNPDAKYVGFHINQLYMPEFSRNKIVGKKPENHPINTERAYQNEVLGEFFAGDSSPITSDQIDSLCSDKDRAMSKRILPSDNKKVYLGCDWGQKIDLDAGEDDENRQQGQSYSCAVVLSPDANNPNVLNVEYATRLTKNSLEYKKQMVEQMFRQFSVSQAVGDIGFANDLTEQLNREYGDKFLASRAAARIKNHVKFADDVFPKEIIFEKDYYISEMFDMMKNGKIRFPYKHFEYVSWLVEHCCSMEIKPVKTSGGDLGIRYVKGNIPNDGFMALLNAFLAYKYDITRGFAEHNPNKMKKDPNKKEPVPAIVGYIPRMNPFRKA